MQEQSSSTKQRAIFRSLLEQQDNGRLPPGAGRGIEEAYHGKGGRTYDMVNKLLVVESEAMRVSTMTRCEVVGTLSFRARCT